MTSLPLRNTIQMARRPLNSLSSIGSRSRGLATTLAASTLSVGAESSASLSALRHLAAPTLSAGAESSASLSALRHSLRLQKFSNKNSKRLYQVGGVALALAAAQCSLGDVDTFFEHKFNTHKKSEDLADFYGTEDFMEVFCVLPFVANLMMRGAEFDDEGHIHARGLLGANDLEVSIDFEEREVDTTGDGEPDTIAWFNKKENFCDVAPSFLGGFPLWKMTQNFGYHRLDNGTCEVYHHGEKFQGFFPIRLIFQLHARYVIWATERYINSKAFGSENDDDSDVAEEFRQNVPLHVFQDYVVGLTEQVQKTKDNTSIADEKRHNELAVTLQRLNTLSADLENEGEEETDQHQIHHLPQQKRSSTTPAQTSAHVTVRRLSTLRSKKTKVSHVRLIVDDPETSDTIRTAMQQIGSAKGHGHEPVARMQELQRHTTLAATPHASSTSKENKDKKKMGE